MIIFIWPYKNFFSRSRLIFSLIIHYLPMFLSWVIMWLSFICSNFNNIRSQVPMKSPWTRMKIIDFEDLVFEKFSLSPDKRRSWTKLIELKEKSDLLIEVMMDFIWDGGRKRINEFDKLTHDFKLSWKDWLNELVPWLIIIRPSGEFNKLNNQLSS